MLLKGRLLREPKYLKNLKKIFRNVICHGRIALSKRLCASKESSTSVALYIHRVVHLSECVRPCYSKPAPLNRALWEAHVLVSFSCHRSFSSISIAKLTQAILVLEVSVHLISLISLCPVHRWVGKVGLDSITVALVHFWCQLLIYFMLLKF